MSTADREVRKVWVRVGTEGVLTHIALHSAPDARDLDTPTICFVERKAYDSLKAENERLKQELEEVKAKYDELKSYLPKVPTQPYEKELAEENERLRSELAEEKQISKSNLKISLIHQQKNIDYQARATKLVDALKFYSDRKKWDEILMLEGAVFGNCEGDPAIVFDAEDDSPWEVARNALAEWEKK